MAGQDSPGVPESSGKSVSAIAPVANNELRSSILVQSALHQSKRFIKRGQRRGKYRFGLVELLVPTDQDEHVAGFHFGVR